MDAKVASRKGLQPLVPGKTYTLKHTTRQVTAEVARVLRPGGLFVFMDSLQMGDKPGWDGMLEAFPHRFHEPYYRHYAMDDLDGMFGAAGLALREQSLPFLSKLMLRVKE